MNHDHKTGVCPLRVRVRFGCCGIGCCGIGCCGIGCCGFTKRCGAQRASSSEKPLHCVSQFGRARRRVGQAISVAVNVLNCARQNEEIVTKPIQLGPRHNEFVLIEPVAYRPLAGFVVPLPTTLATVAAGPTRLPSRWERSATPPASQA
jgi:hypothetical protein